MSPTIHPQSLPPQTADLVTLFQKEKPDFLNSFYLSGGTALALQLGHRESEDLDFFNERSFSPQLLLAELQDFGQLQDTELHAGTLNTFLNGVKLQFLEYPYPLLTPTIQWEVMNLSSLLDIACTKIQTISSRGSKKDFIDLYFLLDHHTLSQILLEMGKKYSEVSYNQVHIIKSLVYFDDAEQQPMPRMHAKVTWDEVKNRISSAVKQIKL